MPNSLRPKFIPQIHLKCLKILVFCRNIDFLMKNHGLGTYKCVLKAQLEILQIVHIFFGPSARIGQLFGIFLKIALITYPLSLSTFIALAYMLLSGLSSTYLHISNRKISVMKKRSKGMYNSSDTLKPKLF